MGKHKGKHLVKNVAFCSKYQPCNGSYIVTVMVAEYVVD